ncbi:protein associated with UVRAG as autophagy enhancer isoform X2 [Thalassophryne amazonica]|uniref:protein associated with UVRAG as autophagy enhancer isoform X2 n=1 Tax=Thalassophryne amazonica TaxID=390379 RepID=UPI001471D1D6|nr:protein associated with UVRAG as autophagy enhancer isoform X2 [Thalassophryne amazonica]
MASSLHRASWYVDSAQSSPAASTASENLLKQQPNGSTQLLILSPSKTRGEEHSPESPEPSSIEEFTQSQDPRSHPAPSTPLMVHIFNEEGRNLHSDSVTGSNRQKHQAEGEYDNGREGKNVAKKSEEGLSLLDPTKETLHIPRSSPVIRRCRAVLPCSPAPSSSPCADQFGLQNITYVDEAGSKRSSSQNSSPVESKKLSYISVSSSLNCLLSVGLHLPLNGQHELAEEHKGRDLTSSDAPHKTGQSTSSPQPNDKERRLSDLPELCSHVFKTSCDLEKENAHFVVVDIVLEVLESVKWTLSFERRTPSTHTQQNAQCKLRARRHPQSAVDLQQDEHRWEECCRGANNRYDGHTIIRYRDLRKEKTPENDVCEHQKKTLSVLSTDSGFEDGGVDKMPMQCGSVQTSLRCPMMHCSAEWLAQQLVLDFKATWLPVQELRRGRQSLRSSLQELPGTGDVTVRDGSLRDEIRLRTRMRGTVNWAPPPFQIIFTVQPAHRFPVSDFSKELLDLVWCQPLYDLTCVGKTLYSRVKELDRFRELQEQLLNMKKLLALCRLSGGVMNEFEQLPGHLTERPHLFSMDDLLRVKKGQLVALARTLLHSAMEHVQDCKLCLARGFICEFCREKDVIFPFQSDTCERCPVCKACFHKVCFIRRSCPKCARIQSRINR